MEHDHLIAPNPSDDDASMQAKQAQTRVPVNVISAPSLRENDACDAVQPRDRPGSSQHSSKRSGTHLYYSSYVLVLVLLYVGLALFAWIVTCKLAVRPITTSNYGVNFDGPHAYGWAGASTIHSFYTKNEKWLKAAQFVHSVVVVFTLPLTSTVCSKAALTFVQQQRLRHLTLRKTITLADRGWSDPEIYMRLLSGGYKQYGSRLLVFAILLNFIGGIIAPLQTLLTTTKTIQTPTFPDMIPDLTDVLDQFENMDLPDYNAIPVQVRSAMAATNNLSPQSRLWTSSPIICRQALVKSESRPLPMQCVKPNMAFGNMSTLPDPFFAELPSGHSTGIVRQYLPRINSTARRDVITEAEYPTDCDTLPHALYVKFAATNLNYIYMTGWGNWSLEACMPANMTRSPWRAVRTRQDFTEELYLNISLVSSDPMREYDTPQERGGLFRISVDTTLGYFELPNYMNGQKPGPLLDEDPTKHCTGNCNTQASFLRQESAKSGTKPVRRDVPGDISHVSNSSRALEMRKNRGPLLTVALVLFGSGSFIADRMARPDAFIYPNVTYEESRAVQNYGACVGQAPFMNLLHTENDGHQVGSFIDPCLENSIHNHDDVQRQVTNFVHSLYWNDFDGYDGERITNAFTSAAFLANEAWLSSTAFLKTWSVTYDHGADTLVPVISHTSVVVISVILGIFLTSLVSLAIYSAIIPRWTDQLDAFAMLRIGASVSDKIQLRAISDARQVKALDELPGWIGDATGGEGPRGELALGGTGPLARNRTFLAHSTENVSNVK